MQRLDGQAYSVLDCDSYFYFYGCVGASKQKKNEAKDYSRVNILPIEKFHS